MGSVRPRAIIHKERTESVVWVQVAQCHIVPSLVVPATDITITPRTVQTLAGEPLQVCRAAAPFI